MQKAENQGLQIRRRTLPGAIWVSSIWKTHGGKVKAGEIAAYVLTVILIQVK